MADVKKILIIGLGYFMQELVKNLADESHPCIAVDTDESLEIESEFVTLYHGDATSIVMWKKLPLDEVSHVIFSLPDSDVAEEMCRIARETFHIDIPIIGIHHRNLIEENLTQYKVTIVNPLSAGINSVKGLIDKNYATPTNIGLGEGEVVEITIVRRSHLINRKLKDLASSSWKVAAIYRDSKLVLPGGSTSLKIGDKVILVGEPKILKNIVNILMQGVPQFPLQYGQHINVVVLNENSLYLDEVSQLLDITQANHLNCFAQNNIIEDVSSNEIVKKTKASFKQMRNYKDPAVLENAGLVTVPTPKSFTFLNSFIRYFLKKVIVPVLFTKGVYPYTQIVTLINSEDAANLLQVSQEMARLSNLPLKVLYVTAPKELRNTKLETELANRQALVREYEGIDRIKIDYTVKEGNPIKELESFLKDYPRALIVLGNNSKKKLSPAEPHIPFLALKRINRSVLMIPEVDKWTK